MHEKFRYLSMRGVKFIVSHISKDFFVSHNIRLVITTFNKSLTPSFGIKYLFVVGAMLRKMTSSLIKSDSLFLSTVFPPFPLTLQIPLLPTKLLSTNAF